MRPPKAERIDGPDADQMREYDARLKAGTLVYHGDAFDIALGGFISDPKAEEVLAALRQKRFTLGRSDASSRVVNHWEAEGVVSDPREEGKGWRRYSIIELVWLGAVLELRAFGVPTETLRKAMQNIQATHFDRSSKPGAPARLFEFYIVRAMRREPVFLLVFASGDVDLATEREYAFTGLLHPLADHVRINLNAVVQKVLPKLDLKPKHQPGVLLSGKELSIVLALRDDRNRRVTVRLKDGEPDLLEVERAEEGKTVHDLVKEGPHLDLNVKMRDGRIVHLSSILKEKL